MVATFNAQGQGLYAQGNPAYTEATRQGVGYNCSLIAAVAPLNAIPTSTAALEIFNNTAGPGAINLIIDSLFAFQLVSTGVVRTASIWAMVTTVKAVPVFTAQNIFSQSGRQFYASLATGPIVTGAGTTVVANGWRPWGPVQAWPGAAELATPGESMEAPVLGRYIVPPGCSLCMHVVSAVATGTYTMGASWYQEPFIAAQ